MTIHQRYTFTAITLTTTITTTTTITRAVSLEISGKFPEICTENFAPVQTFQMDVYLLTSSLSIGFYSTPGL